MELAVPEQDEILTWITRFRFRGGRSLTQSSDPVTYIRVFLTLNRN